MIRATMPVPSRSCLAAFAAAVLCGSLATSQEAIVIDKTAGKGYNPTLAVTSMQGTTAFQQQFQRALRWCDWFKIVNDGNTAAYRLAVKQTPGTPETVDVRATQGDKTVAHFRQSTRSTEPGRLARLAVDRLIELLFDNPGPCASRLAFTMGRGGVKEVVTCNFDGTGSKQLTRNSSISTEASWGARAETLVYTLYQQNATSVVLVDVPRQRQRRLSTFPGLNAGADLSPDGRWAAVCLSRDRRVELYVVGVNSKQLRRLTSDSATESSPCWSPDGTHICYVSDRLRSPQLFVIPASGGTPSRLLRRGGEAVSPDWSPVSNKICFATRRGRSYVLGVVDMSDASREVKVITNAAGDWESPAWAPDGRHVVCSHRTEGGRRLCIVDSWHGRILPVTAVGDMSLPTWSERF